MTAMDEKIQKLDEYIEKLDNAIESNNESEAGQLRHEIISVYEYEIDGIRNGLEAFNPSRAFVAFSPNNVKDAKILRAKLQNYKLNLKSGLHTVLRGNDSSVNVVQNNQQEMHSNITITLQQTISDINSLPEDILSDEEKETYTGIKYSSLSQKNLEMLNLLNSQEKSNLKEEEIAKLLNYKDVRTYRIAKSTLIKK